MTDQIASTVQRTYRKRKRAEQEQHTRERITAATVALHETVGPAQTTVKGIAARAGVQRATVYRHFPDDEALFDACTGRYFARHPMPDPGEWTAIGPPDERFRRALEDLYAWYGETEQMLFNSIRDIECVPLRTRERFSGYFVGVQAALMEGRPDRGRARARVSAAVGHAIGFGTWRSLTREQGLENDEAVALMTAMIQKSGPERRTAQLARRASAVR